MTRLDESIREVKSYYPEFSVSGSPIGTGPVAIWRGRVRPIQHGPQLAALLDDIFHNRPVEIFPGGRVEHRVECGAIHCDHEWMEDVVNPEVTYKIELQYRGDASHPRAFVLDPVLPKSMKHTWGDGSVCPYAPWERVWLWRQHTMVDFMDHVLVWLIKATVWLQAGVWLGDERRHDARYLLDTIKPNAECWCGSGLRYQSCHRGKDEAEMFGGVDAILKEYDRRNPYFIDPYREKRLRRSRRAVLHHQPNTRLRSGSQLANDSRPRA